MSSRWREKVRSGNITPNDKERLLKTGLLNYSKEISGIEKGNSNISKKTGIIVKNMNQMVREELVPAIKNNNTELVENLTFLINHVIKTNSSAALMNEEANLRYVIASSFFNTQAKKLKGEDRRGIMASIVRHEIDEIVINNKLTRKNKIDKYVFFYCRAHISPEVIVKESYNMQMLPPNVHQVTRTIRSSEIASFGYNGARYGFAVPKPIARKMEKHFLLGIEETLSISYL